MTQEERQLLLKDLCARLPYKCKCKASKGITHWHKLTLNPKTIDKIIDDYYDEIKPYLRPLSSMTEEEIKTYRALQDTDCSYHYEFGDIVDDILYFDNSDSLDYLNSIHMDYRDLIPRGLALEAPKNMYKEK